MVMFSSEIDGVDEDAFNRMDSPGMYPCETVALPLSHPQSAVVKLCLGIFLGGKRKVMRVGEGGREGARALFALREIFVLRC